MLRLLTRRQWLQQRISCPIVSDFGVASERGEEKSTVAVRPWDTFLSDVDNFIQQSDDTSRVCLPFDEGNLDVFHVSEFKACHNFYLVLRNVGRALGYSLHMQDGVRPTSFSFSDENASQQAERMANPSGQSAVFPVCEPDKPFFLVIEIKRPAVFRRSASSDIPSMCSALLDTVSNKAEHKLYISVEPLHQLYRYMKAMNLAYGIMSSFDLTFFVKREGEFGDTLLISEGITNTSSNFLGALAYMVDKAIKDPKQFKSAPDKKHAQGGSSQASALGIPESKGSQGKSTDHEGKNPDPNLQRHGMKTRSFGPVDCLMETPAELLHLASSPFATGWSGNIVRGTYDGQQIVVKLAPTGSDRAEALLTEVAAYHKLKEYWGKFVPKLVSYGTTAGGMVVYIATEYINGFEIGIGTLSQGVVKEIFDALTVVHQCGVLHGDIRASNIMVMEGWEVGVRLIDFGFARPIISSEDCMREQAQLERLLNEITCSDVEGTRNSRLGQIQACTAAS
ncbi:hypothetical protein M758_6G072700 [Ceratodon purpureus]|nr:hypothetical protein M758_6G072700 [Ceratodon purpureus]